MEFAFGRKTGGMHTPPPVRILAVASSGGHWQQLMQVLEAFHGALLTLASTDSQVGPLDGLNDVEILPDCNRDAPLQILLCIWRTFKVVRRYSPDLVISTGAAPGLLCLIWGRMMGARTIWIDSIANSETLSLSGRMAAYSSHIVLTQWSHLSGERGPLFKGAIL